MARRKTSRIGLDLVESSFPSSVQKGKVFTSLQLKRRGFFSRTFSKKRDIGVISSKGIFLYEKKRGETWRLHSFFENRNYPVAIDKKNNIYVGPYVSYDRGRTFMEYLNYKPLLKQWKAMGLSRLGNMYISQIIPLPKDGNQKNQDLLLQLQVGKKNFLCFWST